MPALKILVVESDPQASDPALSADQASVDLFIMNYQPGLVALVKDIAPDIMVLNSAWPSERVLQDLHSLNHLYPCPVIVFTQDSHPDTLKRAMQANVADYHVAPLTVPRLTDSVKVAQARFQQLQHLKSLLAEAQAKLEDRKKIDQAKAILIKTRHYTEDEAYHTLRKLAMDRHTTLGEMAKQVIAMADLLK